MKLFSHCIAALMGLGLFSTGCDAGPLDDEALSPPPRRPLDGPTGHVGVNGLRPSYYQYHRTELDALLQQPLLVEGALNTDQTFNDFIANGDSARVFAYAVECAIPLGIDVGSFPGAGLMATAGSWLSAPLDAQQRRDIHTCVTVRLNPYGEHVPLWIGGPSTTQDTSIEGFDYFEAVWSVATPGDGTDAVYSVWPADAFTQTQCATRPELAQREFDSRICENNPKLCTLNLRTDMATACTGQPGEGNWICDGKPAIETRLNRRGWEAMHPLCFLP